jgi:hypothetical protein
MRFNRANDEVVKTLNNCFARKMNWHLHRLDKSMILALAITPMFAAAGWAFLYLLCGGGLGGAFLIFIVLKMFGR